MAHMYVSVGSNPSREGTLPVRLLLRRSLREGRSRGMSWDYGVAADARHTYPQRDAAPPPKNKLRSTQPPYIGRTRQGQWSAQRSATEGAVASCGLHGANGASGCAAPEPGCEHQQRCGAAHAAPLATMGGAKNTTAGSVLQGAHLARAAGLAPSMQRSAKAGGALGVQEEEQAHRKAAQHARKARVKVDHRRGLQRERPTTPTRVV